MAAQNYLNASRWCVKAAIEHGFLAEDCSNLAFVAFGYCSRSALVGLYDDLIAAGVQEVESNAATFLRLSFELELASGDPEAEIERTYFQRILEPKIKRMPRQPILYWHIPKCSGTSINESIRTPFYSASLNHVWPGYTYRPLVKYLIENELHRIPYASSVHLGTDVLRPKAEHFSFAILRDPALRCLSMYRQEMSANAVLCEHEKAWHHYRALPRYGDFWDYRLDTTFDEWLENIPKRLLARQLTTFSPTGNVAQAGEALTSLSYLFCRDFELGSEAELFEKLDLDYSAGSVPTELNRSDKSIAVPETSLEALKPHLKDEYTLLDSIKAGEA